MSTLLDIRELSVDFTTRKGTLQAIRDVTLSIEAGETVCLVGESGSGKTVASKAIMRLIDHENGRISGGSLLLDGTDLAGLPEAELRRIRGKRMAMVFQEPMAAFDPVFTIGQQIQETILQHEKVSKREARERAVRLLKRVGIPEPELRLKQYPGELSGGMLQRAMIAMALSCGPDLLIADEPTTALDVTIQAQILRLLKELQAELGMSILLITHDLGIAAEIADRVVVMYAGEIVEEAPASELFRLPRHPYTRGLLRSVATLDTVRGTKLHSIEGSIPSLAALPQGCRFHPRCPFATERCMQEAPVLTGSGERRSACWHAEELVQSEGWMAPAEPAGSGAAEGSGTAEGFGAVAASNAMAVPGAAAGSGDPAASSVTAALRVTREGGAKEIIEGHGEAGSAGAAEEADALFTVDHLKKYYPVHGGGIGKAKKLIRAVDDVSFTIRKRETFGLVGESGSGKSTLGRVLLQMERATSGTVLFDGKDLTNLGGRELRAARQHMQTIFQDPYGSLDPRWKIGDSIAEPLKVHGQGQRSPADISRRVSELLELVGLDPSWAQRYPHEFSGGQRQRIGIARAIALNPRFILADEAVSALDVSVQAQIINLLQDLQQKLGLTYLFIAHGLQVVRHLSDRIGVMYLGKLVEIAPSESLFLAPAHPYTQALIEAIPQTTPRQGQPAGSLEGEIPSPANPPSGCRFHTRCPFATDRCRQEEPALRQLDSGHHAACHYAL
ncbi:glutathione ABC transporter ATP-binding protein [Paenibacillus rhizosphaerae]|uniref:Glutathione ABC transporter ATP-binding protein n=1 Tax=Paenibacillus rhizosphaerae TaxID=297318 RepID=A0A1R1ECP1_9BACL|nr:ABC transporter ATP-binding protein [Paenibacillus rhizosphaerae]OMF49542.1 glutathione ABC transporter ATP-binding protein [Paenibacillus rhizosphaerae]